MKPLVIGVAGGSGSGKSTVAHQLVGALPNASVAFLDMDAYYRDFSHLDLDARRKINWDHPESLDLELFAHHIDALVAGNEITKPIYDFVHHVRSPEHEVIRPADVIVADGILLFVDELVRARCDVKVFVDADADIRLIRRIRRDIFERGRPLEEIVDQYLTTVQPMHLQFVEPSKRYADVIIPRGGHNAVAIDMLIAQVQRRLAGLTA